MDGIAYQDVTAIGAYSEMKPVWTEAKLGDFTRS